MGAPAQPGNAWMRRATLVLIAAGAGVAFLLWRSSYIPMDAPVARMYRAEADLEALANALSHYQAAFGTLPPEGAEGLRKATDHLGRIAGYFPGGPPLDPWGRPYDYRIQGSAALLRSLGKDGAAATADDIVHGAESRPWRRQYKLIQGEAGP